MKKRGPLFTLLAVAVFGFTLLGINMARPEQEPVSNAAAPATTGTVAVGTSADTSATTTTSESAPAYPAEATYTGRTSAASTSIALATKSGKAVAYVCDGRKVELWLQGTASGDTFTMQAANGQLTGAIKGGQVTGTVRVGTQNLTFTAAVVNRPAGLYRASSTVAGVTNKVSWIVQADGSEVGLLTKGADQQPAPQLDPAASSVVLDGTQVPVSRLSGEEQTG
jgi:hypothetical protein